MCGCRYHYDKQATCTCTCPEHGSKREQEQVRLTVADLKAENERLRALVDQQLGPCTGCYEAPEEHCPRHGRSYTDMLESMDRMVTYERARVARAEALAEEWLTERIDVSMHGAAHELKEAIKYV